MRLRAPAVALGSTAAGLAAVFALQGHGPRSLAGAPPGAAGTTVPPRGTGTTTVPARGTGTSTPTTTSSPPSGPRRTATGKSEQYGYGTLSVRVTVEGSHITAVSVAAISVADPTSGQIAAQVDPMLRGQVLSMQTWRINGVSGATYSSAAYAYSLQSALAKLHVK